MEVMVNKLHGGIVHEVMVNKLQGGVVHGVDGQQAAGWDSP